MSERVTIMRVDAATYGVGGVKERGMEVEREGGGQHLELRKIRKRKKKQRKIARGIFRSLAPLLGLGNCRLSLGLWYRADDTGT